MRGSDDAASLTQTLRERIRCEELKAARPFLTSVGSVLEVGGATGLQARVLHEWGNDVASVDISLPDRVPYFPVQLYDGHHLPFPDAFFDVVFSSNVLEHIDDLPSFFVEAARVLKASGRMVHIVPTPIWRFWTNLTHYVWVVRVMVGRGRTIADVDAAGDGESQIAAAAVAKESVMLRVFRRSKNALIPKAHGVYPGALSELYYYSAARWRGVFERNGFQVTAYRKVGIVYSGYRVFPSLDIRARQWLARWLGSSCHVFVLSRKSAA